MMSCKVPIPASEPNGRRSHNWPKQPEVLFRMDPNHGPIAYGLRFECLDCNKRFEQEVRNPRPGAQPKEIAL